MPPLAGLLRPAAYVPGFEQLDGQAGEGDSTPDEVPQEIVFSGVYYFHLGHVISDALPILELLVATSLVVLCFYSVAFPFFLVAL